MTKRMSGLGALALAVALCAGGAWGAGTSFTWSGGASGEWAAGASWTGGTGSNYPGQASGDTAILGTAATITVNASPANAVIVTLNAAVTISPANTFTLLLTTVTGTARNLTIGGAGNVTISGAIATTTGTLTMSGTGILTLQGANTFSGGLTVTTGTVTSSQTANTAFGLAGSAIAIGDTTPANSNNATLEYSGTATTLTNPITVNAGSSGTLTIRGVTNTNTFTGTIALNNNLTVDNTASGKTTTFSTGALTEDATAHTITKGSGAGTVTVSKGVTVGAGGLTCVNNGTTTFTFSGGVTGTGNLELKNNGATAAGITLTTTSVNNTGAIINSGSGAGSVTITTTVGTNVTTITENSASSALSVSGAVSSRSTSLTLDGSGNALTTLSGGLVFTGAGSLVIGKTGTNGVTVSGGTITLGGTGGITINGGSSAVSLGAATISAVQNWANNSSNALSTTGVLAINSQLTLTAGIIKFGSSTNTGTGGVVVNGATAQAGANAAFGTGTLTLTSGTVSSDGGTARSFSNAVTINGSVTLGDATNNGTLTFTGAKTVTGSNTITLAGSGGATFSTAAMSLASGSNTTFSSGSGALTLSGGFNFNSGTDTLTLNTGSNAVTLSGTLSNAGTLVLDGSGTNVGIGSLTTTASAIRVDGSGTYTFSGTSTFTGGVVLNNAAATYIATAAGGFGSTSGKVKFNQAGITLELKNDTGTTFTTGLDTTSFDGTIKVNRATAAATATTHTLSLANSLGANTVTVNAGANITGGTAYGLTLSAANTLSGTPGFTVNNNGAGLGTVTLSGALSAGASGLTKDGAGLLILNGVAELYTGTTTVLNGTLRVSGAAATLQTTGLAVSNPSMFEIDSTATGNVIPDTCAVTLNGGTIKMTAPSNTLRAETVGAITCTTAGASPVSKVILNGTGTGNCEFTASAATPLTINAGASLIFYKNSVTTTTGLAKFLFSPTPADESAVANVGIYDPTYAGAQPAGAKYDASPVNLGLVPTGTFAPARTFTSNGTGGGDWAGATTWDLSPLVPGLGDSVIINGSDTVTLNGTSPSCLLLTFNGSGQVVPGSGGTLTVYGAVVTTGSGSPQITCNMNVPGGDTPYLTFSMQSTGKLTVSGTLSGAGGVYVIGGAGTLQLNNASNAYTGATEVATGVLEVTGGNAIPDGASGFYLLANARLRVLDNEQIGNSSNANWSDVTSATIEVAAGKRLTVKLSGGKDMSVKWTGAGNVTFNFNAVGNKHQLLNSASDLTGEFLYDNARWQVATGGGCSPYATVVRQSV